MNASVALTMNERRILRVLNGRLAGAEHRLHAGKFVRVGHGFDHDIVLRGSGTSGLSVELDLLDDIATIRVIAGSVMLLGRPLAAGESAHLPFYVPISIGEFSIAVGEEGAERWAGVADLLLSMGNLPQSAPAEPGAPAQLATAATPLERMTTRLYPFRAWVDTKRDWPKYGFIAGLIVLAFAIAGPSYDWIDEKLRGAAHSESAIAAAGFKGLQVVHDDVTKGLVVTGTLQSDKDLARLRSFVLAHVPQAIVDVQTTEAHAAAAAEILGAQGIDGEVKPLAVGTLLVKSEFLPKDRQDEIIRLFRQDLPAVSKVSFAENKALGERDLQYFFSSGDFGLASFVDGSPSYLVTADGTRWFAGATVPTGHKILSLGNGRIAFERDGRVDELVL